MDWHHSIAAPYTWCVVRWSFVLSVCRLTLWQPWSLTDSRRWLWTCVPVGRISSSAVTTILSQNGSSTHLPRSVSDVTFSLGGTAGGRASSLPSFLSRCSPHPAPLLQQLSVGVWLSMSVWLTATTGGPLRPFSVFTIIETMTWQSDDWHQSSLYVVTLSMTATWHLTTSCKTNYIHNLRRRNLAYKTVTHLCYVGLVVHYVHTKKTKPEDFFSIILFRTDEIL